MYACRACGFCTSEEDDAAAHLEINKCNESIGHATYVVSTEPVSDVAHDTESRCAVPEYANQRRQLCGDGDGSAVEGGANDNRERDGDHPTLNDDLFCDTQQVYHTCGMCDYRSTKKHTLAAHERVHTGERPYACLHCDYRASHKKTLTRHMRVHTGERPHACDFEQCSARFTSKSDLTRHRRTHSGEKPFVCMFLPDLVESYSDLNYKWVLLSESGR